MDDQASLLESDPANEDGLSVPRLTKHAERNLYIRSLVQFFQQRLGEPHYSRIADVVTAVTGDAVDSSEVSKIVKLSAPTLGP